MAYVVRPAEGLHFSLPGFPNCVIAAYDTGGVGEVVFLGTAPQGSIEYDAIEILWGPDDMTNVSGGAGGFLNNVVVARANDAIARFAKSSAALVQKDDPVSVPSTNNGLHQYFAVQNGKVVFVPAS